MTEVQLAQAERTIEILEKWCAEQPGRTVTLSHDGQHWRATMNEEAVSTRGASALDSLGQAAQVAAMGGP